MASEDHARRIYAAVDGMLREVREKKRLTVGDDGLGLAAGMAALIGLDEVGEGAWRLDVSDRVAIAGLAKAEGVSTQDLLHEAIEMLLQSRA
jgi:hypothetical protein